MSLAILCWCQSREGTEARFSRRHGPPGRRPQAASLHVGDYNLAEVYKASSALEVD